MFKVYNRDNEELFRSESFIKAQASAMKLKDLYPEKNFDIVEIKQVWTTQTLDEAMSEPDQGSMYELVREQEGH